MQQTTEPTGDALSFLQRRVGLFGLTAGGLATTFLIFRIATSPMMILHPSMLSHALAGFALFAMWIALRGKQRTVRFIRLVELLGLSVASALLVLMGTHIPLLAQPGQIVVMALAVIHTARAVYVPSTGRRTGVISAVTGVVLVLMVYESGLSVDMESLRGLDSELAAMTKGGFAMAITLNAAAWWLLFSVLDVAASRVIYGLRKQVGAVKELGQYHIDAELGSGAMGIVYRAHHALLRRDTAVKLLPPERAGEAALARFEREVKLTAQLKHPNTVTIYDYGRTPDGIFYYAMELLEGATLEQVVEATGAMPAERVVHIMKQAVAALAEAHELGLIHRDIKPANIMLCNQGGELDVVKVLDYGLVKQTESDAASNQPGLTQANTITGTPLYMAPESLVDPLSVDARSDLYALGAVMYYLLVGDHVFNGSSLIEVCSKHLHEKPVPPSRRSDPPPPATLEQLVLECLEKEPEKRPQTARDMLTRLAKSNVKAWQREDAQHWWQVHEVDLDARHGGPVSGSAQTIAVDIAKR